MDLFPFFFAACRQQGPCRVDPVIDRAFGKSRSRLLLVQIKGVSTRVRQGSGDTEPLCRLKRNGHKRHKEHKKNHRLGKARYRETGFVPFVLFVVSVASGTYRGECRSLQRITLATASTD